MRVSSALRSAEAPPLAKWYISLTIVLFPACSKLFNTIGVFSFPGDYRIIFLPGWLSYYFPSRVTIVLFSFPGDYRIIFLPGWLSYYFPSRVTIVLFSFPGDYRIIFLPGWLSYYFPSRVTIVLFSFPGDYRIIFLPGWLSYYFLLLFSSFTRYSDLWSTRDFKNSTAPGNFRVYQGIM